MITTEPDREHTIKIGDQYYRPIIIKVEYQQNFPRDLSDEAKELAIRLERAAMLDKLNSAIHQHMIQSDEIRGSQHTYQVELMILKPIKNGKK